MFYDNDRVAEITQISERVNKSFVVSWWRPIVGSSSTNSAPTRRDPSWDASLIRCASPPESVFARLSRERYSSPTLSINWRLVISRSTGSEMSFSLPTNFRFFINSCASLIDIEVKSTIFFPGICICPLLPRCGLGWGSTNHYVKCFCSKTFSITGATFIECCKVFCTESVTFRTCTIWWIKREQPWFYFRKREAIIFTRKFRGEDKFFACFERR